MLLLHGLVFGTERKLRINELLIKNSTMDNLKTTTHFNPKNSRRLLFNDCLTFFSSIRLVRTLTGTAYSGCGRFVVCRVNLLIPALSFEQSLSAAVSIE